MCGTRDVLDTARNNVHRFRTERATLRVGESRSRSAPSSTMNASSVSCMGIPDVCPASFTTMNAEAESSQATTEETTAAIAV